MTTTYYLVGNQITREENGTDILVYHYDSTGKLISVNLNGSEYFYMRDLTGTITGLHDATGNIVVEYKYDTWGRILSTTGSLASTLGEKNPYRFKGYYYDEETGLYYLNARYYNPEWGRFINADSELGDTGELIAHNIFAYCSNNSVMNIDPSGQGWLDALFGCLVVAAVAVLVVVAAPVVLPALATTIGVTFLQQP